MEAYAVFSTKRRKHYVWLWVQVQTRGGINGCLKYAYFTVLKAMVRLIQLLQ